MLLVHLVFQPRRKTKLGEGVLSGFAQTTKNGIVVWIGSPNCQSAHDAILEWLKSICSDFPGAAVLDARLKGNLGESIGFYIGKTYEFGACRAFAANALSPFRNISQADLDIVWVLFADDPKDDIAVLQEVKTTSSSDLAYADKLTEDYAKLFGPDPRTTLHTRLQGIKARLRYEQNNLALSARIAELASNSGQSAKTATQFLLVPTLLHERTGTDPIKKMVAVRSAITGIGWQSNYIQPYAIGLTDLDDRLLRLANEKP
jgi:hypothetical protein